MNHPKGLCEECGKRTAHYEMFRTRDDVKKWIRVCEGCENIIGHENLLRARRARGK